MNINFFTRPVILGVWAVLLLALSGCGTVERPSKPSASGRAGELLVVMEQRFWEDRLGPAMREVFRAPVPMLPQIEPMFHVVHVDKRNFSRIFETHRHIFMVEIDQGLESPTIEITRDVFSYPQLVVRVTAPDQASVVRIIENNRQEFYDRYLAVERVRLINAYQRMQRPASQRAVREMFDLEMVIPEGYFVASTGEDFIWLRKTATNEEFDQAVMIWTLDYTDPEVDFDTKTIWARRDSITRQYIPGQFPGTYMTTYNRDPYLPPDTREIDFNGKYAIEARSLWRVEGDFMGGPFVTITFVDEQTNRLFMIDGWVFAPKYDKRDYMRQVEAIMWSARLLPQDTETDKDPEVPEPPAEEIVAG